VRVPLTNPAASSDRADQSVPSISVVIVNYNSGDRLSRCLAALEAQTIRPLEVIVWDNASTDDSNNLGDDQRQEVALIQSPENAGFAAGNNRAVEYCHGEWVAFLNPDAYPKPDWIAQLIDGIQRYQNVDAFGSTQINALNPSLLDGEGDYVHVLGVSYRAGFGSSVEERRRANGECFAPCAAASVFRLAAFRRLGGFDERFFCYSEDVDLGFRLRLMGGRSVQLADAIVDHEGSGVAGRHSAFTVYHGHRNRIWMTFKCMPLLLLILLEPLRWVAHVLLLVRMARLGQLRPYLKALVDGYRGLPGLRPSRADVQKERSVSTFEIARQLIWNPVSLVTRRGK